MKTTKKILSLVLVLMLVFALAAPAMADGAEKSYPYEHYFSIGDSIARGCGMPLTLVPNWAGGERDSYFNDELCFSCGYVTEGAFPQIIRDTVGAELNNNLSVMGLRSVETYWALGGDVDPYEFDDYCAKDFGSGSSRYHIGALEKFIPEFITEAGTADLITVQIGSNDIFYSAQARSGFYGLGDFDTNDLEGSLAKIGNFLSCSWEGYENFKEYYPKIIDRILELQMAEKGTDKDVKIVLVGCYGPFGNTPVMDGILIHVGDIFTVLPDLINKFLKDLADQYEQCVYVDIDKTETPITMNEKSLMECLSTSNEYGVDGGTITTHPTANGHAYIAEQILDAIAVTEDDDPDPKTYVQFKLPNACTVDTVLFGVVPAIFEQSADGKNITVTNFDILQTNMTVIGHTDSGKQVIFTYALHYNLGQGYSVYRIAGTTDVGNALNRAKNSVSSLFSTIGGLFGGK